MEFTTNLQLYKPRRTDTKQSTLDELANNADKIESFLYSTMTEINVRTPPYNLKGDGTDTVDQIQSLFNLANTNGTVYLYFPKGVYPITGRPGIRVYKNTFVRMHNEAIFRRTGAFHKMFMNGQMDNTSYQTGYNGDGNIHFKGGTLDLNCGEVDGNGNKVLPNSDTVSAFDLGHGENISFTNVTVKNGQIGHGFQVTGCKNVLFRDCWFGGVTYSDTSSTEYEFIQIEAISSDSFPTFGSYDLTPSRDIFIENCTFDTVIRAIGTHSDALYGGSTPIFSENVRIENCKFFNSFDNMVNLTGFKDCKFENNLIDGSAAYGIHGYKVEYSSFKSNTILNTQKSGIHLDTSHKNKFKGNTLRDVCLSNTYSAFRLTASNDNTFDDDTVYADTPNYSYAYYSDTSTGNKIRSNKFAKGKTSTIGGDYSMSANLTWVSVGDSITAGNNSDATYTSGVAQGYYQDHALPLMPKVVTHYNRGYGGYTMAIPGAGDTYTGITSVDSQFETADIYTVFLGTNDFSRNVPVGSYASSTGATNDFYGGMKQLYVDLTGKNMNAIIIFVTPLKRTLGKNSTIAWDSANTAGFKLVDYVNAIKDFGSNYGCPVLDLFNESGISNRTASTMLYDYLHPYLDTNKRIGKMIANKINMYI